MGVPAFFRWLVEKYPKVLVDVVNPGGEEINGVWVPPNNADANPQGREFDCLYLDMNGIIHPCAHPEGRPAPETEDDMIAAIFEYVDYLFSIVRPRKLLYLAIDGVAPRAKMNQQRSRRFRAAQEAAEAEERERELREELISLGREVEPWDPAKNKKWDSNVITPGTKFMDRVAHCLRYFVVEKMNTDRAWRNIKVFLSDASVPGEGEHKIMEFMRVQKMQAGYDANMSHVIYGLDADLIMLSLATHEPNMFILREQVTFTPRDNKCIICGQSGHLAINCTGKPKEKAGEHDAAPIHKKPYQLLYVSVLREYLERDLQPRSPLPFPYDLERMIDDFVFLCFFVGNDFLPHLPTLSIHEGAIDMLMGLYARTLPTLDGYLTKDGEVRLSAVAKIMQQVADREDFILRKRRLDEERNRNKRNRNREARIQRQIDFELRRNGSGGASNGPESTMRNGRRDSGTIDNIAAAKALKTSIWAKPKPASDTKPGNGTVDHIDTAAQPTLPTGAPDTRSSTVDNDDTYDADDQSSSSDDELAELEARYGRGTRGGLSRKTLKDILAAAGDRESAPVDTIRMGDEGWKQRYYKEKFGVDIDDNGPGRELAYDVRDRYVEGLCWVMKYYYQGCASWTWYFPYHYSPFATDLVDMATLEGRIRFEKGRPFRPLEQLMGVLPPASAHALPPQYALLMTSEGENSLIDYYPTSFRIDLNGKRHAWQGVALLPFIDEKRLLAAVRSVESTLTPEERRRNRFGHDILFVHAKDDPLGLRLTTDAASIAVVLPSDWPDEDEDEAMFDAVSTPPTAFVSIDTARDGLAGSLTRCRHDGHPWPLNKPFPSPFSPNTHAHLYARYGDLRLNRVLAVTYALPAVPDGYVFPARLLPGAKLAPRALAPADFDGRSHYRLDQAADRMLSAHVDTHRPPSGQPRSAPGPERRDRDSPQFHPYDRRGRDSYRPPREPYDSGYDHRRDYGRGPRHEYPNRERERDRHGDDRSANYPRPREPYRGGVDTGDTRRPPASMFDRAATATASTVDHAIGGMPPTQYPLYAGSLSYYPLQATAMPPYVVPPQYYAAATSPQMLPIAGTATAPPTQMPATTQLPLAALQYIQMMAAANAGTPAISPQLAALAARQPYGYGATPAAAPTVPMPHAAAAAQPLGGAVDISHRAKRPAEHEPQDPRIAKKPRT